MKNDFCLDTFMIEVIHMENVVWIFCVKIAFSYENDQNVFFFLYVNISVCFVLP